MKSPFGKGRPKNRVLVLIDFENILVSMREVAADPKRFIVRAFDRFVEEVAQEVGEIVHVFAFVPPHLAVSPYADDLVQLGFTIVFCPKIKTKEGGEEDSVDSILTEFGKITISQMPDLTHLCIGSGDKDFSPLARAAKQQGLKVIVVAGSLKSLSNEMILLTERKPGGGQRVYLLSLPEK